MTETKTLLIVDDNPLTREGLRLILRQKGYETILATNGDDALDCLRAGSSPDLILLDMLMPISDGWQFLSQLRREFSLPLVPVIVISSIGLSNAWAKDRGCCAFIEKPIDLDSLLTEVQQCLERCKG